MCNYVDVAFWVVDLLDDTRPEDTELLKMETVLFSETLAFTY